MTMWPIHPDVYKEIVEYNTVLSRRWRNLFWRIFYLYLGVRQSDIDDIDAMVKGML